SSGGRNTIIDTVTADPGAVGYARIASGKPCPWCAMLISRGPVYKESTAYFEAHDNCSCTARPMYSGGQFDGWTEQGRQMRDLWRQANEQAREEGIGDVFSVFRTLVNA